MNTSDNEKMREALWYVGAQNDALYIINSKPRPSNDDQWNDSPHGPTMALLVAGLTQEQAQAICDAHNSTVHTQEVSGEAVGEIEKIAEWLDNSATLAQSGFDSPPEPQSQFDYELIQAAARLRELCSQLQASQQQEQSGEAVSVSTAELTLIERLRGLAAMIESQDGWRPTAIDEAITAIEYQEAVISDFQSSPATPTATASQESAPGQEAVSNHVTNGEYAYEMGRGLYEAEVDKSNPGWPLFHELSDYERAAWIAKSTVQKIAPPTPILAAAEQAALVKYIELLRNELIKVRNMPTVFGAVEKAILSLAPTSQLEAVCNEIVNEASKYDWECLNRRPEHERREAARTIVRRVLDEMKGE